MAISIRAFLLTLTLSCALPAGGAAAQDARLEEARQARAAGRLDDAAALLEAAHDERPDDPDLLRMLGSAYANLSRFEEAIATLRRAQTLAPADRDIALALGRALLWSGDVDAATAQADALGPGGVADEELAQLRSAIERARTQPQGRRAGIAFGQGVSAISIRGRKGRWYETLIAADVPVGRSSTLSGDVNREDRGRAADTRLGLRWDRKVGKAVYAHVAATVTPRADFRDRWSVRAGGEALVAPHAAILLDLRHADFGTTNVTVVEPAVRLQSRDGAFNLTVRSINLWAERNVRRSGWAVRAEAPVARGATVSVGGSTYPETEAGITRRVRGLFAGTAVALSDRLTLRAVVDHETRVATYRRTGVAISLGWRLGR